MSFDQFLDLIQKYLYRFSISTIGITDIVEIIIISAIVYQIIKWLQLTRAWTLFKGIIVLLLFALMAVIFQLDTIAWLLSNSLSVGIMAAIVIFQPELRRALEQLGRKNFLRNFIFSSDEEGSQKSFLTEKGITEIVRAVFEMSKVKTGALIVIEQRMQMTTARLCRMMPTHRRNRMPRHLSRRIHR